MTRTEMRQSIVAVLVLALPELLASALLAFQAGSLFQMELAGAAEHALVEHGGLRLVDLALRRPFILRELVRAALCFGSIALLLRPLAERAYVKLRRDHAMPLYGGRAITLTVFASLLFALDLGAYVLIAALLERKLEHASAWVSLALALPFLLAGWVILIVRDLSVAGLGSATGARARSSLRAALMALKSRPARVLGAWATRAAFGAALLALGGLFLPRLMSGAMLIALQQAAFLAKTALRGSWLISQLPRKVTNTKLPDLDTPAQAIAQYVPSPDQAS
jgi:hypothetical protein